MSYRTIGTCSLCGGPVRVPLVWMGSYAPKGQCANCRAYESRSHGPVIAMEPPAKETHIGANTLAGEKA